MTVYNSYTVLALCIIISPIAIEALSPLFGDSFISSCFSAQPNLRPYFLQHHCLICHSSTYRLKKRNTQYMEKNDKWSKKRDHISVKTMDSDLWALFHIMSLPCQSKNF
eukprot:TRINITY_DN74566_c0_g1_i1.p1 TRINITY_DN74566_c0_g1~~TRINITY_DN74566_c0_g1_i1.p1  ORF type:complete len:109 (-),score=4.10 TRINITY_DN74566_c0_g1_i1:129-455(-)